MLGVPLAAPTVKSVPAPVIPTLRGLPAALSVIVSVAARDPAAVGLKLTLIVQLPPAPTLAPQLSVLL